MQLSRRPSQLEDHGQHHLLAGHLPSCDDPRPGTPSKGARAAGTAGPQQTAANKREIVVTTMLQYLQAGPRLLWSSGLTCSFLASLVFSFSALFVKLTGGRVPVLEVCFLRSAISFALSILLMSTAGIKPLFGQHRHLKLLFIRGCTGALTMTMYLTALFLLPLGDAVTINLIGPPFTAVAARIFLKEPLGYKGMAGCAVSVVGVVVLAHPPFLFGGHESWGPARAAGTMAAVGSALLGSGSSMIIRLIGSAEPAATIALWFHTCTMILTAVPLAFGIPNKFALMSARDSSLMAGVAVTSFAAQLLGTRGLQIVVAAKACAMGFTQVLYSYVMGGIFFHEKLSLTGLSGVSLILLGVIMVTMKPSTAATTAVKAAAAVPIALMSPSWQQPVALQASIANCISVESQPVAIPNKSKTSKSASYGEVDGEATMLLKDPTAAAAVAAYGTPLIGDPANSATGLQQVADAAGIVAVNQAMADSRRSATARSAFYTGSLASSFGAKSFRESLASAFVQPHVPISAGSVGQQADVQWIHAHLAAEAAAALGGEVCPASATSIAVVKQASMATALGLSRHPSLLQSAATSSGASVASNPFAAISTGHQATGPAAASGSAAGGTETGAPDGTSARLYGPRQFVARQISSLSQPLFTSKLSGQLSRLCSSSLDIGAANARQQQLENQQSLQEALIGIGVDCSRNISDAGHTENPEAHEAVVNGGGQDQAAVRTRASLDGS